MKRALIVGFLCAGSLCAGESFDFVLSLSGLYWCASQEGLDFAIQNAVRVSVLNPTQDDISELNNLIDAEFKLPKTSWEFGFKLGLGYANPCDDWTLFAEWTRFSDLLHSSISTDINENQTLLPLYSAFAPAQGNVLYARAIDASWKLCLHRVDATLRRCLAMNITPIIGLSYIHLRQKLSLEQCGGSWSPRLSPDQDPFSDTYQIHALFRGIGILAGVGSTWDLGCGWGLFGQATGGIASGRFKTQSDESITLAVEPHSKTKILDLDSSFRAARPFVDLQLGLGWCWCGMNVELSWEEHVYFDQNQFWRVNRTGDTPSTFPNMTGENVFEQMDGSLSVGGLTFSVTYVF